jgi:hypothetical protein
MIPNDRSAIAINDSRFWGITGLELSDHQEKSTYSTALSNMVDVLIQKTLAANFNLFVPIYSNLKYLNLSVLLLLNLRPIIPVVRSHQCPFPKIPRESTFLIQNKRTANNTFSIRSERSINARPQKRNRFFSHPSDASRETRQSVGLLWEMCR